MQFSRLSVLVAFLSLVVLAATGSPISDTDTEAAGKELIGAYYERRSDTEAGGEELATGYYKRRSDANIHLRNE